MNGRIPLAICFVSLIGTNASALVTPRGDMILTNLPAKVMPQVLQSNTQQTYFMETVGGCTELQAPLHVDIDSPGLYGVDGLTGPQNSLAAPLAAEWSLPEIPTGTRVRSYFVHVDPWGAVQGTSMNELTGGLRFSGGERMLGLITTTKSLKHSNPNMRSEVPALGNHMVKYGDFTPQGYLNIASTIRGMDIDFFDTTGPNAARVHHPQWNDAVFAPDNKRVFFKTYTNFSTDQARVITTCTRCEEHTVGYCESLATLSAMAEDQCRVQHLNLTPGIVTANPPPGSECPEGLYYSYTFSCCG